jgi:hypothetical protein
MAQSLFQRKPAESSNGPLSPIQLIEREIDHLKRGTSVRHGNRPQRKASAWFFGLAVCASVLLYILDPIEHAWYRGDAISAYLYLHSYGTGHDADRLAGCGILRPEEVAELNDMHGSYQDSYDSPQAAARSAQAVVYFMTQAKELRAGHYYQLDWLERVRYILFIRTGLVPPLAWDFLDPGLTQ